MKTDFLTANYFIAYVTALLFFGVGAITTIGLPWFTMLSLPGFTPNDTLTATIWCVLFLLAGISACLVWDRIPRDSGFNITIGLYMANALLVLLWNYLFFGLHMLSGALDAAVLVLLTLIVLIVRTWHVSQKASWLLVPYLAWMVFAIYLSYVIMTMNP